MLESKNKDLYISSNVIEKIKRISVENSIKPCLTFLNPDDYKISYLLHSNNNFPNKYKYLPFP